MIIYPIKAFTDNYIWALVDKNAALFDCMDPGDAQPVLAFAQQQGLSLRSILITHHHNDHIGGVNELKRHYPHCAIYGPIDSRISSITHPLKEGQQFNIGSCKYKVLATPGHTSTHISYFEEQQHWLFCGDTLFASGCGRVFDGTIEQLHHSLMQLKSLPTNTQIFCAHEYTLHNLHFAQWVEPQNENIARCIEKINDARAACTLPSLLEQELLINPFLRTDKPEVQNFALVHGALSAQSLEIFRVLREQKNSFK